MKEIKVQPIPSIQEGEPILAPDLKDGELVLDAKGKVKSKDATIIDLLEAIIANFPQQRLSMATITEGVKLKEILTNAKKNGLDVLALEDSTYKWVVSILKDEQVGVKLIGFNLPNVLKSIGAE